jgi:nucleoid DNA-binding protein
LYYKSYYSLLPTIPVYPDNIKESKIVKNYMQNRTQEDVDFFHETNKNVVNAFLPYVEENLKELNNIISFITPTIVFFKYTINRARPEQVDKTIVPIDTSTAKTPAYPAGHAYQAYYLSKILSKKYPNQKKLFESIAEECDLTRVKAGLHYPSDGKFSRYLVDLFN